MKKVHGIPVAELEGIDCVTIEGFANLIGRSVSTVRRLLTYGNSLRKLKAVYAFDKPFIPLSELHEYPFRMQGRDDDAVFHFEFQDDELIVCTSVGFCGTRVVLHCGHECLSCIHYKTVKEAMEENDI